VPRQTRHEQTSRARAGEDSGNGHSDMGNVIGLVGRTVAEVERDLILETLRHCFGNRTRAAAVLGISLRTLRNKLNDYAATGATVPRPGREMREA
jgi:two-component system, response regulator FlrC